MMLLLCEEHEIYFEGGIVYGLIALEYIMVWLFYELVAIEYIVVGRLGEGCI